MFKRPRPVACDAAGANPIAKPTSALIKDLFLTPITPGFLYNIQANIMELPMQAQNTLSYHLRHPTQPPRTTNLS